MTDWYRSSKITSTSSTENRKRSKPSDHLSFHSRRSPTICRNGCVSSSQPLASSIGLQMLTSGGNAADAALAMAAALAVLEPCSTGLGGDMFALYYDGAEKSVSAVNGSGRCPGGLTLGVLERDFPVEGGGGGIDAGTFCASAHSVTVPGAARGWEDFYKKYASGSFRFGELLEPAAKMAEEGFPVAPFTARYWADGVEHDIKRWLGDDDGEDVPFTVDGKNAPKAGDIFRNPSMASVLRSLGQHGATQGFYNAFPGQAIVDAVRKHGGVMTMDDMHEEVTQSTFPQPISVTYRDKVKLWQVPPNGQGIAGLIGLTGFQALANAHPEHVTDTPATAAAGWSAGTWHAMIEAMRLAFADARAFVCDTEYYQSTQHCDGSDQHTSQPQPTLPPHSSTEYLLDPNRITQRILKSFSPTKATIQGLPDPTSCTVSFQVVDKHGNAVSFVNSNYMGFGTGIVPQNCGFTLQNRGFGFSLDPKHPNALAPRKRPFHTIVPAILTHKDNDDLYATMSNMGGFMQPQGHMQLTVGLVGAGLDPQAVVDMPRFCIADGTYDGKVFIEDGVQEDVVEQLQAMGHRGIEPGAVVTGYGRSLFGKAQIIKRDRDTGVLWAGSDGRADGCAMGY